MFHGHCSIIIENQRLSWCMHRSPDLTRVMRKKKKSRMVYHQCFTYLKKQPCWLIGGIIGYIPWLWFRPNLIQSSWEFSEEIFKYVSAKIGIIYMFDKKIDIPHFIENSIYINQLICIKMLQRTVTSAFLYGGRGCGFWKRITVSFVDSNQLWLKLFKWFKRRFRK